MNTAITNALSDLPPATPRGGAARILFLSMQTLGWKTFTDNLVEYAGKRPDVEAVHVLLRPPTWMRLLNRHPPAMPAEASIVHPMTTWRWALSAWLARNCPPGRFDVVHCSPVTLGTAPARMRKFGGYRLSCSTDSTETLWAREIHGLLPQPRKVAREAEVFSACDVVAPWSQWVGRSLVADYGLSAEQIVPCRPAIGESLAAVMSARRKSSDVGGLVRMVFVGNDWERKGGPRVLRWHQSHFIDRVELHVVSAKAPRGNARNVIWHGSVDHARLLTELLPTMDLFVFPTRFDALPAAIIEAVTAGLPVVASSLAAIPELVRQGENGLICPVDDEAAFISAIETLVSNSVLRQTMSDNATAFAQREMTQDAQFGPLFDRFVKSPSGG